LLLSYPAATTRTDDYIRSAVKIEAGAKSALDPHMSASVTPYIAADLKSRAVSRSSQRGLDGPR
jgi:hypothetical protein